MRGARAGARAPMSPLALTAAPLAVQGTVGARAPALHRRLARLRAVGGSAARHGAGRWAMPLARARVARARAAGRHGARAAARAAAARAGVGGGTRGAAGDRAAALRGQRVAAPACVVRRADRRDQRARGAPTRRAAASCGCRCRRRSARATPRDFAARSRPTSACPTSSSRCRAPARLPRRDVRIVPALQPDRDAGTGLLRFCKPEAPGRAVH